MNTTVKIANLASETVSACPTVAPLLSVKGLKKTYGNLKVFEGINFSINPGSVNFLIGPSGGGKSTFLRCLNFLESPTAGSIIFEGVELCSDVGGRSKIADEKILRQARAQMPMVFQGFNLFNHKTVLENIIEGPIYVKNKPKDLAIHEAEKLLERVGLRDKSDCYPAQLSGGQKQRVAIARAVAMEPQIILFDEPTSALDPERVSGVLDAIKELADEGRTMVIVTHEMAFAKKLADVIYFVADGGIVECGTAEEIFERPKSDRLKQFISSIIQD